MILNRILIAITFALALSGQMLGVALMRHVIDLEIRTAWICNAPVSTGALTTQILPADSLTLPNVMCTLDQPPCTSTPKVKLPGCP